MEAIRTKDKLFLAVVVPVALTAAYVHFWRTDAIRRVEVLTREDAALVSKEEFPVERTTAAQRLSAARAELETERRTPAPATRVKAKTSDSTAERERAVIGTLRQAGLVVERSGNAENGDTAVREVLKRTGLRPKPVCRQYVVIGSYPKVCAALQNFAEREMAILPDRIEMTSPRRWTLALWL